MSCVRGFLGASDGKVTTENLTQITDGASHRNSSPAAADAHPFPLLQRAPLARLSPYDALVMIIIKITIICKTTIGQAHPRRASNSESYLRPRPGQLGGALLVSGSFQRLRPSALASLDHTARLLPQQKACSG